MSDALITAGLSGQGATVAGRVLAQTRIAKGKQASFLCWTEKPANSETKGSMVVITEEQVTLDTIPEPEIALVFDNWAMEKVEPMVKQGGILVADISNVTIKTRRKDINLIKVPARETAHQLGNPKMANMVMMGALTMVTKGKITTPEIIEALKSTLRGESKNFLLLNKRALLKGEELFRNKCG